MNSDVSIKSIKGVSVSRNRFSSLEYYSVGFTFKDNLSLSIYIYTYKDTHCSGRDSHFFACTRVYINIILRGRAWGYRTPPEKGYMQSIVKCKQQRAVSPKYRYGVGWSWLHNRIRRAGEEDRFGPKSSTSSGARWLYTPLPKTQFTSAWLGIHVTAIITAVCLCWHERLTSFSEAMWSPALKWIDSGGGHHSATLQQLFPER